MLEHIIEQEQIAQNEEYENKNSESFLYWKDKLMTPSVYVNNGREILKSAKQKYFAYNTYEEWINKAIDEAKKNKGPNSYIREIILEEKEEENPRYWLNEVIIYKIENEPENSQILKNLFSSRVF